MKRSLLLSAMSACLTLSACAISGGTQQRASSQYGPDVDVVKVATVNLWAQTKGATVVWINYPQKPRTSDSDGSSN